MSWKKDLGRQIRDARLAANLTQGQLASRVHLTRQMISRYEVGRDVPTIEALAILSRTLNEEFEVHGFRITVEQTSSRLKPRPLPKQFRLDFEKSQQYRGATINITPSEGHIFITAKIPA
jgi:transcriptional regulator with XRE-family HTH domain